jgi:maltooligosyltrehalose trehalohydrolase
VKRRHRMPFGAELLPNDGARFRLWAPDAQRVELWLDNGESEQCLPMPASDNGWFEIVAADARAHSRYCFRIDGEMRVPDPASRRNPDDVHRPSEVTDPDAFDWRDADWRGRPWEDAVIYELHVGSFTPSGDFAGVMERLDHLHAAGITAIELMPIADFPGARNWGYDGVLPFAPDSRYGTPDDLKRLVQAAHLRGLMVFLDVVYNHFGPEGNYLHLYARRFFTERHHTPWGAAINFDGPDSRPVRDFFIHNALYWLEEFHFDGLRFDAVHAIHRRVAAGHTRGDRRCGARRAGARTCRPSGAGERRQPARICSHRRVRGARLPRAVERRHPSRAARACDRRDATAITPITPIDRSGTWPLRSARASPIQGEASPYRAANRAASRACSCRLPRSCLPQQNHDQIGNRAFGERLTPRPGGKSCARLRHPVARTGPAIAVHGRGVRRARAVSVLLRLRCGTRRGRDQRSPREFARFARFAAPEARAAIPDPSAPETFAGSRLDWRALTQPQHQDWLAFYRNLLALRRREIVPRIPNTRIDASFKTLGAGGLEVGWRLKEGVRLILLANLGESPLSGFEPPSAEPLYLADPQVAAALAHGELPPWTTTWWLDRDPAGC